MSVSPLGPCCYYKSWRRLADIATVLGRTGDEPTPTPGSAISPELDLQSDGVTLRWPSGQGTTYRVRRSPDLKIWETLATLYFGTGDWLQHHESFVNWPPSMFYSIETQP